MTITAIIPAIVMLVGLIVWFYKVRPAPWGEFGRTMFWVGLLVLVLTFAHETVKLGTGN